MASARSSLRAASVFLLFSTIRAAFTPEGCFPGTVNGQRTLDFTMTAADDMTIEKCAAYCSDTQFFGLEYGRECYCGQYNLAIKVADRECSFSCAGNASQKCGAGGRLNLYTNDDYLPPVAPAEVGDYAYASCFADDLEDRALPGAVLREDSMTLEKCADFCAGYEFFGVEYGSQCFCGTSLEAEARPEEECRQRCGGNPGQVCGDSRRLNVYGSKTPQTPGNPSDLCGYSYQSCWTDNGNSRTLRADVSRTSKMTVETCAEFCEGYKYFGLENGGECFCGDSLLGGNVASEKQCGFLCNGDKTSYCGGPDRLSLYVSDLV